MIRTVLVLALVALAPAAARAEILPSFRGDVCAARASHVVVVNDKGEVLESWRGDLVPGDRVPLAHMKLKLEHDVTALFGFRAEPDAPKKVTGKRLVLFLRRGGSQFGTAPEVGGWAGADGLGDFDTSAAWVEGARAYALAQWINPGPQQMLPTGTEAELKKLVVKVNESAENAFASARAEKNLARRADALAQVVIDSAGFAGRALDGLEWCGTDALPALRKLAAREFLDRADLRTVYRLMAQIGAPAKADLMKVLAWQLPAWKDALGRIEYNAEHKIGFTGDERDWLALLRVVTANPGALAELSADEAKLMRELRDLWANHAVLSGVGEKGDRVHDRLDRALTEPNR